MHWAAMIGVLVLGACEGTQAQLRLLEHDNALRIDVADSPTHDYVVHLRNIKSYNSEDPGTRQSTALLALQAQCPRGARIVGERTLEQGTYMFGIPARTYMLQVKCV